jgi:hypothetical protein
MSKKKDKQEQKQKDKMKENKKLDKKKHTPTMIALGVLLVLGSMAAGQAFKPYGDGLFSFLQTEDLSVTDDAVFHDQTTFDGNVHLNAGLYMTTTCNGDLYIEAGQVRVECDDS